MRAYTLGNGSLHVGVDEHGIVRDIFYPHVGLENHVGGRPHRIGVQVDGEFSWIDNGEWQVRGDAESTTFAGTTTLTHDRYGVIVRIADTVYNERDIFIREFHITNSQSRTREVKLFFCHEFYMWGSGRGDTGYYDPEAHALVHYQGRRIFLAGASVGTEKFDQYTVGIYGIEGKEGSYRDAEDGELSMNPIEHGVVDSVMRLSCTVPPDGSTVAHYWLVAGRFIKEVHELNEYVVLKSPHYLMKTARDYWSAWLATQGIQFADLPAPVVDLFKKSLLVIRAHADKSGAIIASTDSDIKNQGRDTYSYMWPRDAAYAARALILAGDTSTARALLSFCNKVISDEGYFMHKYLPDGSIGSSWHPFVRDGKRELPIQEDETAIILVVLREYYVVTRDIEFVEEVFNTLVRRAGDFLLAYVDARTGLPRPSYDLWEEKYGVTTYTASCTYAGLTAAAYFAWNLGKRDLAGTYLTAAEKMQLAIVQNLYDTSRGTFYKALSLSKDGQRVADTTIDASSVYGIFAFGVLPPGDQRVRSAITVLETRLLQNGGGVPRYEGDCYYRTPGKAPNPWHITTLWRAQYYLQRVEKPDDLKVVREILDWVVAHASPSGMLSEQLDPTTGAPVGTTPLVWSHAEFVTTVIEYLQKMDDLGLCKACYPLRRK